MTLQRFIDYIEMDKEADPTYRAYDLLHYAGPSRISKALRMAGYDRRASLGAPALYADLSARGVELPVQDLPTILQEWFIWQRIADGKMRRWPYRAGHGRR